MLVIVAIMTIILTMTGREGCNKAVTVYHLRPGQFYKYTIITEISRYQVDAFVHLTAHAGPRLVMFYQPSLLGHQYLHHTTK
jgi:hypothetical protein